MVSAPEVERSLRERLDNWRLWTGIAYFGLAAVVVALFFINKNTQKTAARAAAAALVHQSELIANANAQYTQCVSSIPLTIHLNEFLQSVYTVDETILKSSLRTVRHTPHNSPLYKVRVQNVANLSKAIEAPNQIKFPVQTKDKCLEIRRTERSKP